mmetsp:Transcript_3591/g.11285  ORF Transcript_3591/g.11285 Transcript_3591/m.11285 type:complete len:262 (-) Transcript_3591:77-862(-)
MSSTKDAAPAKAPEVKPTAVYEVSREHEKRDVLLVKITPEVAKVLESIDGAAEVGYVEQVGKEISMHLTTALPEGVPDRYKMRSMGREYGRRVISVNKAGARKRGAVIAGAVTRTLYITPEDREMAAQVYHARHAESYAQEAELRVMEEARHPPAMNSNLKLSVDEPPAKKKARKAKEQEPLPDDELRALILKTFGKEPFWKLRELANELEQPQKHVKRNLMALRAEYINAGVNVGKWMLPEDMMQLARQSALEDEEGEEV